MQIEIISYHNDYLQKINKTDTNAFSYLIKNITSNMFDYLYYNYDKNNKKTGGKYGK